MTREFYNAMCAAAAQKSEPFLLTVAVTGDNLQYGVTPYWNAGGGCYIEWGDGGSTTPTASGAAVNHTYAAAGTYIVAVTGQMHRFRCSTTNPGAVTLCNGNWPALGNITDGNSMFANCANMELAVDHLPPDLTNAPSMFYSCKLATLPLAGLPDGLISCANMFQSCEAATMNIRRLPSGITAAQFMFYRCLKMTADLDAWVAANPGGWPSMTSGNYMMYYAGNDSSPGTVTGSNSAFTALCPNATFTLAFYGTNTTA